MQRMTWHEANEYITELNKSNYLGYNDWRLPTVQELVSLFDYDAGKCIFPAQGDYYWSGSTYAPGTNFAWFVYMSYGHVRISGKDVNYYVWPVRSGQINTKVDNDDGTYTDNQTGLMWAGGGENK